MLVFVFYYDSDYSLFCFSELSVHVSEIGWLHTRLTLEF